MQFLLRFHRFRRLLNSATAALSSRIDAHTLAGPQRVFAFPQDVVSQASKMRIPRDVKLPIQRPTKKIDLVIFIARLHAMHAERDIVMTFLSVSVRSSVQC